MTKITAQKREKKANLTQARNEDMIPAVYYGPKTEATSIFIKRGEFLKAYNEAGESSSVEIESDGKPVEALISDVQRDPVTDKPVHVDFLVYDQSKPVEIDLPIVFEGEAPAVKNGLGTLTKVLHAIVVEGLLKDIPHDIVVDVSILETVDDQILAKDIKLPSGVSLVTGEDEVVAMISVAKEEEEEEPSEEADLTSIEVEKKGKQEETEGQVDDQTEGDN